MFNKNFYKAFVYLKYITKTQKKANLPAFWIFLDELRIADYKKFITMLPRNYNNQLGIIFRNIDKKKLMIKYRQLARICRYKKIPFLVSDNLEVAKALGASGIHFSKLFRYARKSDNLLCSCSFHGYSDTRRIKGLNADLVFVSPIFKTNSSHTKKPLGLLITGLLFNYIKSKKAVMGGLNLRNIKFLKTRKISCAGGLDYVYNLIN